MTNALLDVVGLNKEFQVKPKSAKIFAKPTKVQVLNDISFEMYEGETLSIVGESGCGKTTLGRCLVRGIPATSGQVIYRTEEQFL